MTFGSLFSGCGGADLGLERAGMTCLWQCEFDRQAKDVLRFHHPELPLYPDVRTFPADEVAVPDVLWMSPPCFTAGVMILTSTGYRPIETLSVGDLVLSHDGTWNPVERIGRKMAATVELKGQGCPSIRCTPEHPFYGAKTVRRFPTYENGKRGNERHLGEPGWVAAKDMKGHRWAVVNRIDALPVPAISVPVRSNKPKPLSFDCALAYVVGRWLGDGWVRDDRGIVVICCSKHEEEDLRARLDVQGLVWTRSEGRTTIRFECSHGGFAKWLTENFGKGADGKLMPGWAFGMDLGLRSALLQGYADSDGWQRDTGAVHFTTVGHALALSARHLMETLGYSTSLHRVPVAATTRVEGRTVNQREQWQTRGRKASRTSGLQGHGSTWYSVTSVEETGVEEWVYDIQVGNAHSYVAEGLSVHNCQDLSVAGKRAGLAGERSGLFYDAISIATRLRARGLKWVLMEQVPGLFSSNGGEDVRQALVELSDLGLSLAWRVLDSQWFGVPQRRRRAFFVVDLGGERAGEVLALAQGLRGDSAPSREKGERVAASLTAGSHPGSNAPGRRREDDVNLAIAPCLRAKANSSHRTDMEAFVPVTSLALTAGMQRLDATAETLIPHTAHTLRAEGFDASEDGTGRGTPLVPYAFPSFAQTDEMAAAGENVSPTLKTDVNPMAVAFTCSEQANSYAWERPVYPTLNAQVPNDSSNIQMGVRSGMAVRRLTPRECERLQGWEDDRTRYGRKEDGTVYELADGPRYKQCGNGVTATVSEWIARNLIATELSPTPREVRA